MGSELRSDGLERLAPEAREPQRARLKVGIGAAIVLLIAALIVAVIVSMLGQQSGRQIIEPNASGSGAEVSPGQPQPGAGQPGDQGIVSAEESPRPEAVIFVHILGAVARPGLFELQEGARVMDAVAAAGGLADSADPAGVNLARLLVDGEQLYVPVVGEVAAGVPAGGAGTDASGGGASGGAANAVVNLNTATVADLETLPRIGPAMAQRILDYRDANGRFSAVEDLQNITGIGEKTFEALKDLVTV